jgi:predicted transposase YbfD/YdcC
LIEARRTVHGTTTVEQRYYLLNQRLAAATVNDLVRSHWGIENQVHPEYSRRAAYDPQSLAPGIEQREPQHEALPRCA